MPRIPPPVVVGIEATGSMGWFLRLMEELGDRVSRGASGGDSEGEARRQKHDRRDAALLLQLLAEDRFPAIWMPSTELRDLRALLLHRHQWVRMRTRVQNALQAIALGARRSAGPHVVESRGPGDCSRRCRWRRTPAHRRSELQALYRHLDAHIDRARSSASSRHAQERPRAHVAHDPSGRRARHGVGDRSFRRRPGAISRRERRWPATSG